MNRIMKIKILIVLSFLVTGIVHAADKTSSARPAQTDYTSQADPFRNYLISEEVYPRQAAVLGQGWHRRAGRPMQSKCVYGEKVPIEALSSQLKFYDTFDRETINNILNASVKASYMAASGAAKFSREVNISKSKRNILAVSSVDKGGSQLVGLGVANPRTITEITILEFTPRALKLLNDKTASPAVRLANFQRECGDSFVGTIRTGGKLVIMFQVDQTVQGLTESFSAEASGGYGALSASGSVSSALRTQIESTTTQTTAMQEGGELMNALDSAAVLKKIQEFPNFSKELSTPYVAILVPYQTLPSWPKDLQNTGMSDWLLSIYFGQASRLLELGQLYADAATNPEKYYFPFLPKTSEDAEHLAASLYAASSCVTGYAESCTLDVACDQDALTSIPKLRNSCPGVFEKLSGNELATSLALLLSKSGIENAPTSLDKPVLTALTSLRGGTKEQIAKSNSTSDSVSLPLPPENGNITSIFSFYYKLLAIAPLHRTGKDEPVDEAYQVKLLCDTSLASLGINCALVNRSGLTASTIEKDKLTQDNLYRHWVLSRRLAPLAATFCRDIANHPMCLDPISLGALVRGLKTTFGSERNFTLDAAPVQLSQPKAREPRGYIDPCDHPSYGRCIR